MKIAGGLRHISELREPERSTPVTLAYPPSLNTIYATVRGRRVLSKAGRAYKIEAATCAYFAGLRPVAGDVAITLHVYRPRKVGDLDNTLKIILDSLRGIAWEDDKQVVQITARRFDDAKNPRVELWIEPVASEAGVLR